MTSAFQQTKHQLAKATLLVHPVSGAELRINTDASARAIAGAVHQVVKGQLQPLGFFSRRTSSAESRYLAYDQELLAVYSTLLKFRHMLEGRTFRIYTDQKPLTSAFLKAKDPVSNRQRQQLAVISEFTTDIAHVPGMENVVADALTRQYDDGEAAAIVHSVSHMLTGVDLGKLVQDQLPLDSEPHSSLVLELVKFPGVDRPLVCDTSLGRPRVLVPLTWRRKIFEAVHDLSHPSGRATLGILARTYAWSGMRRDILRWARQCRACQESKVARHTRPSVKHVPVPATRFDHVHVDLVGPFTVDRGYKYLLTMVDRTTRWPEAIPIPDTTAETVVQAFLDNWVARFGIPTMVTTDRGAQFTSELWRKTLTKLGISANTTTA